MSSYVWGSNTIAQFEPKFAIRFEWDGEAPGPDDATTLKIRKGEKVHPSRLPSRCVITGKRASGDVPAFFFLDYYILSEPVAQIFKRFDLGNGYLHPFDVLDEDRSTVLTTHYILVADNAKSALLPEKSCKVKLDHFGGYKIPVIPLDDMLVMSKEATEGPDVWHHDPFLKGLYLSERLVGALKEQKYHKLFHLFRVQAN